MASPRTLYVSASTNRYFQAADVSSEGLIAFGSSKLVALWDAQDPLEGGVFETLPGHEAVVTCVRFVRDDLFVSADEKGVLRVWRKAQSQWHSLPAHQAHKSAIATVTVQGGLVVTGASDNLVKVWTIAEGDPEDAIQEVQTIILRKGFPISLSLSQLPQTQAVVLAIGSTDRNVHLWTRSEDTFVPSAVLSGHEDWVKCLAFRAPAETQDPLILASGSQDGTIRLWNIEPFSKPTFGSPDGPSDELSDELLDAFEASLANLEDGEDGGRQISLKRHILTVKTAQGSQLYSVTFDALLIGHEAGVTSLSWRTTGSSNDIPTLLSTSTDSSLILWSPSTVLTSTKDGTTLWINRQRFGDVGGQRLGGFVGGLWARAGNDALAWGWGGGWRRWRCNPRREDTGQEEWTEVGAISGHHGPVRSVAWSPGGEYLLSASSDQTTRVHGPVKTNGDGASAAVWHEIARPQVHGYDLIGAAFLDALRFVSISDEKVARVFEAPREFVEIVNNLGVASVDTANDRPRTATVPPLGLSNKAVVDGGIAVNAPFDASRSNRRLFEGELAAMTLWPEVEKIFGHGYESIASAVSNNKRYIATACKATSAEHAVVRVYDTNTWQPFGEPLAGHALTVTRIAFSPDDNYVLSVSRDRTWRLFEKTEEGYAPLAADKSHGRIIWDCGWAPEGDLFATASRDKTIRIWSRESVDVQEKWSTVATMRFKAAATAVSFAPARGPAGERVFAAGLESGEIFIYRTKDDLANWQEVMVLDSHLAHADHIHALAWRPTGVESSETHELASCSEDGTVKVFRVHMAGTE